MVISVVIETNILIPRVMAGTFPTGTPSIPMLEVLVLVLPVPRITGITVVQTGITVVFSAINEYPTRSRTIMILGFSSFPGKMR